MSMYLFVFNFFSSKLSQKLNVFYKDSEIIVQSMEKTSEPRYEKTGFLAHLSQRLIGELIGYSWSGVRPASVVVRRKQFQTSSQKPLGRSKPNFMWSLLG